MILRVQFAPRMSSEVAALKRMPPHSGAASDITLEEAALGMPSSPPCHLLTLEWVTHNKPLPKKPVLPPPRVPRSLSSSPAGTLGKRAAQRPPTRSLPWSQARCPRRPRVDQASHQHVATPAACQVLTGGVLPPSSQGHKGPL